MDQKVLLLKGNPAQFLNGLTSNTLDKPHNAFLNMHGRIIATFDQICLSDEEFLIVIASKVVVALFTHVERYLKINRSTLTEIPMHVYFDLDSDAPLFPGDHTVPQKTGRLIILAQPREASETDLA